MDSVVTFLTYLEFPNSILIKNQKIERIILTFPDSSDMPPLAKCAAPLNKDAGNLNKNRAAPLNRAAPKHAALL